ncbi:CPBP family intramembrane glutamic endopeptidase [Tellurirhabdus rosea]|uniref:CPBP family intramembrane glutamic endopeptidase n=1 Tax=Tellurirhabdus rosea TaxID=2674997 RepID=UPI00224D94F7|nr:CPBP family intramembrane glutamic endopeptidase [Tellurirhabdus rosea]
MLILLGFVLIGMSVGGLLAMVVLLGWTTAQGEDAVLNAGEMLTNPELFEGSWYALMMVQAVSHAFTFLVPCLLFWRLFEGRRWADFNARPLSAVQSVGLVALLTIAFMPLNGLVIDWNQGLELPPVLESLETWMKQKEEQLGKLTAFLTTFSTPLQLVIAVFVIAVLPAVGEELLFRGIVQRKLIEWTANVHAGIWIAAFIFSAIHMQFYGFIPRVLLGALFGYLYVWSRNLWVPILAHFVNNGFTVLMVWLYRQKMVSVDIENTDSVPLTGAFFSLLLTIGFLYYFRKSNQSARSHPYV